MDLIMFTVMLITAGAILIMILTIIHKIAQQGTEGHLLKQKDIDFIYSHLQKAGYSHSDIPPMEAIQTVIDYIEENMVVIVEDVQP